MIGHAPSSQVPRQRAFTRRTQFAADRVIVLQIERAQQRLERESLDHQRAEHDGERGQHDQVAIRKRRGSASAAASDTMPRMPAHEMIRPLPTVGRSIGRGG